MRCQILANLTSQISEEICANHLTSIELFSNKINPSDLSSKITELIRFIKLWC